MPLQILTDSDVHYLLQSLTAEDIAVLHQSLADALHLYSTAGNESQCCSDYQPQRTSLKRRDGMTTLVMPASSSDGVGVKVVTLSAPSSDKDDTASISSTPSNTTMTSATSRATTTPIGSLTLFDPSGAPTALINATELTAFRTALASTLLFKKRHNVHTLTVFGAGKQAYWHIRLALLLRPSEIHHVNIISRTFERAGPLLREIYSSSEGAAAWPAHSAKVTVLSREYGEYARLLKEHVRKADTIFCCTPSAEPLFPAEYLTATEGRRKGRYVAAIGSYRPHMLELAPEVLQMAVKPHDASHRHFHKHARSGGAVVVDSLSACLEEAGEVIQAGLRPEELVELGELLMLKREREGRGQEVDAGMREWIEKGNVVYKSVGLGLMDVVVGGVLARLAGERWIGMTVEGF